MINATSHRRSPCAATVTLAPGPPYAQQLCATRVVVAQGDKLPLHYAAENGASLEVVNLLLGSDTGLASTSDKVPPAEPAHCPHAAVVAPRVPPLPHHLARGCCTPF